LLQLLRNDRLQKTFKVETIEWVIEEPTPGPVNFPVPQPKTFENDADVCGEIKDWLLPIVDNYRLFVEDREHQRTNQMLEDQLD